MFHREKDGRKGVLLNVNRAGISALDIGGVSMNFAISSRRYCLLFNQIFVRYAMQRVWIHVDEENLKN